MNCRLILSEAPHVTKKNNTTSRIMLNVLISLLPIVFVAIYYFGYMVAVNIFFCLVFCGTFELLYGMIEEKNFSIDAVKKSSIWNLSFAVTAVILALNLPSTVNLFNSESQSVIILSTIFADFFGSLLAIVFAKMLFGGIGRNFANPALLGRITLVLCFTKAMTTVVGADGLGLTAVTGATWLKGKEAVSPMALLNMFLGNTPTAAVGETCAIAIIIGFIYLVATKTIDFRIPLTIIITVTLSILAFEGYKYSGIDILYYVLAHLLSGGLLFGAVFMATDYATNPNTRLGKIIFAAGIGFLTVVIRCYNPQFPEGMSFAILLMNFIVPTLDRYIIPKPFGTGGKNE